MQLRRFKGLMLGRAHPPTTTTVNVATLPRERPTLRYDMVEDWMTSFPDCEFPMNFNEIFEHQLEIFAVNGYCDAL